MNKYANRKKCLGLILFGINTVAIYFLFVCLIIFCCCCFLAFLICTTKHEVLAEEKTFQNHSTRDKIETKTQKIPRFCFRNIFLLKLANIGENKDYSRVAQELKEGG